MSDDLKSTLFILLLGLAMIALGAWIEGSDRKKHDKWIGRKKK